MTVQHFLTNVLLPISVILNFLLLMRWQNRRDENISPDALKKMRQDYDDTHQYNQKPSPLQYTTRLAMNDVEKIIVARGFQIANGPDRWSIMIIQPPTKDNIHQTALAHYWPKKEWFNLIGREEKGRGLGKMLMYLELNRGN